jgi:hypothetical protein
MTVEFEPEIVKNKLRILAFLYEPLYEINFVETWVVRLTMSEGRKNKMFKNC